MTTTSPERYSRDLDLLATCSSLFNTPMELDDLFLQVARAISGAFGGSVALFVPGPVPGRLEVMIDFHPEVERHEQMHAILAEHPFTADTSQTGLAFAAQRDVLLPDPDWHDPSIHPLVRLMGVRSYMAVRIQSRGEMLGMLAVACFGLDRRYDEHDLRTLRAIADQAANAMSNARYLARELRLRQRTETLFKISKAMRSELDMPMVLQDTVDVTWQFLQPDFAGVFVVEENHTFQLTAATDLRPLRPRLDCSTRDPDCFMSSVLARGSIQHVAPFAQATMCDSERRFFQPSNGACCFAVPLYAAGSPQGVLVLIFPEEHCHHDEDDQELMASVAELAALAIENHLLIRQEAVAYSQRLLAEHLTREREALIRQIVHDLRNSTQAISLINEEIELSAEDRPDILNGVSGIDRQLAFIANFLKEKLAWIKHSQHQERLAGANLAQLVERVLPRFRARFAARSQPFELSLPPEEVELTVSEVQFDQIVGNLLDNASKYAPEGSQVRFWCALSDGWVTLYVSDDGPGIPLELQSRLGEPGFKGAESGGQGMGLVNVKKLATANGGLFGFTSQPGSGSTFHVTLPTTRWGQP